MMKSFFLAIAVLCVLACQAQGQEPSLIEKIKQIEAGNASLGQRVNALEAKVDAISVKVERIAPPSTVGMVPSFQTCNTATGQCSPGPVGPVGPVGAYYAAPGDSGACGSSGGILSRFRERRAARRGW